MKNKLLAICTTSFLIYSISSQASYYVGDRALGGTVFLTNRGGTHGLIVANQNQGDVRYVDAQDACSNRNKHDLDGRNYFDWRVPTQSEFKALYDVKSQIAPIIGIKDSMHWVYRGAPKHNDVPLINYKDFSSHWANVENKTYNLRCVRSF